MDTIYIYGGKSLLGQTKIQGSKNAVLPILAATLLIEGTCVIENCPDISDVRHMIRLLISMGCRVTRIGHRVEVDAGSLLDCDMPSDSVGVMRSSIMLLGALLARMGSVRMQYPGGCVIGSRPIDLHLQGLRKMGVAIAEKEDGFYAETQGLVGAFQKLPFVSVGATENLLLAAVLATGETTIENAAKEPEICALCEFLTEAGAKIEGAGTDRLVIQGVKKLYPVSYRVPADRIVAGTYVAACLCSGGEIFLKEAPVRQMTSVLQTAQRMGATCQESREGLIVACKQRAKAISLLQTDSYPGFPTDLQSAFLAVLTVAEGESVIKETIFENRFRIVPELEKMGACIQIQEKQARIVGVSYLQGTVIQAEELRGGAALVIAGAAAQGRTVVTNRHYIERGYEDICSDLQGLGVSCEKTDKEIQISLSHCGKLFGNEE